MAKLDRREQASFLEFIGSTNRRMECDAGRSGKLEPETHSTLLRRERDTDGGSEAILTSRGGQRDACLTAAPVRAKPQPPRGPEGHVNTLAAAQFLGLSVSRTRQLASSELIPARRDSMGRWCFRPDQLQMVRQACRAAEQNGRR